MRTIGCLPMTAQRRSVIFIFVLVASAPGAIPGILVVPAIRGLPDAGDTRLQMLRDDLVEDVVNTQARLIRNSDEAVHDKRLGKACDDVVPPVDIGGVVFE